MHFSAYDSHILGHILAISQNIYSLVLVDIFMIEKSGVSIRSTRFPSFRYMHDRSINFSPRKQNVLFLEHHISHEIMSI